MHFAINFNLISISKLILHFRSFRFSACLFTRAFHHSHALLNVIVARYAQARILYLEAEAEHMKVQKNAQESKQQDERLTESLRQEVQQVRRDAERAEKEYAAAAEERDKTRNELEEMKKMYAALEKRMKAGT